MVWSIKLRWKSEEYNVISLLDLFVQQEEKEIPMNIEVLQKETGINWINAKRSQ